MVRDGWAEARPLSVPRNESWVCGLYSCRGRRCQRRHCESYAGGQPGISEKTCSRLCAGLAWDSREWSGAGAPDIAFAAELAAFSEFRLVVWRVARDRRAGYQRASADGSDLRGGEWAGVGTEQSKSVRVVGGKLQSQHVAQFQLPIGLRHFRQSH